MVAALKPSTSARAEAGTPSLSAAPRTALVRILPASGWTRGSCVRAGMSDSYLSTERSTTKSFQGNKVPDTAPTAAGLGITLTSLWGRRAEIERDDLIRIIEDWAMEPVEAHALFPPERPASPAARAFIDYLAPQL